MTVGDNDVVQSSYQEILDAAPEFRSGDDTLTAVYRHRWESFARNTVRSDRGWLITEFPQPGPGRAHGTVNAAAGHHVLEGRWLRRPEIVADYLRFWYEAPEAESHRYTEWIAWAALEFARLQRAWPAVGELLPGMISTFRAWEADSLHSSGLYWAHDLADAMEFSISGDGLRPSINSYQYGNAVAIAELARRVGNGGVAEHFEQTSADLRQLVLNLLYDPEAAFFTTLPLSEDGEDAYVATAGAERRMPREYYSVALPQRLEITPDRSTRELIGFLPWYFDLPGEAVDPLPAVAQLTDPEGFAGQRGLTTAERRHPRYRFPVASQLPRFLCRWNGPSWPFATSQTLSALARIARGPHGEGVDTTFLALLRQYAASHLQPDGSYWLDEDLDPDTGAWIAREWRLQNDVERAEIGRDYQHSTFADLVLSGLLGLDVDDEGIVVDPLPAVAALGWFEVRRLRLAGAEVSVSWDPQGGLRLGVDDQVARRDDLGALRVTFAG